jgi:hypothetical protein
MGPAERIASVRTKIARAPGWTERLNAPLSESTLVGFERKHSVVLPEDYRHFLREVANGGGLLCTGGWRVPEWDRGIWPLERWYWPVGNDAAELPADFLAQPSPIVPGYMPNCRDADEYRGLIPLAHEGCGWLTMLVVSGTSYGHVVSTDGGSEPPVLHDWGFLPWLDEMLDGVLERSGAKRR